MSDPRNSRVNDYADADWALDPLETALREAKKFANSVDGKRKKRIQSGNDEDALSAALRAARGES